MDKKNRARQIEGNKNKDQGLHVPSDREECYFLKIDMRHRAPPPPRALSLLSAPPARPVRTKRKIGRQKKEKNTTKFHVDKVFSQRASLNKAVVIDG